jgi:hypothetical protein
MTPAQETQILDLAREGKTIREIARSVSLTCGQIYQHSAENAPFQTLFSRAQAEGLELWADEIKESASEFEDVQRARLHADNLKWLLARKLAHKYGDRLNVEVQGSVDLIGVLADARRRLLPVSNQQAEALAQDAEFTQITGPMRTDNQSVTPQLQPVGQAPAPLPAELE